MLNEKEFYDEVKDWNFDEFQIVTEEFTNWDIFNILKENTNDGAKILDLGTGGGEKVIEFFPKNAKEILATDLSEAMIETANNNLKNSDRTNVTFRVMDNKNMDVPHEYFDIVVARNTVTCPAQIYEVLKPGGLLLLHGVDKYDCHELKRIFGRGQSYNDSTPISIIDYEAILDAGFKDVELVPLHEREYFKNKELFSKFLHKVPILDGFSDDDELKEKNTYIDEIEEEKLDEYINRNTYEKGIRLIRRYYGITARK